MLKAGLAIADKRRTGPNVAEVFHIIGDVKDKNAIIVDDIVDTAGTLSATIRAVKDNGAKKVSAVCTHGIFSGEAIKRINDSPVYSIYTTDTVPLINGRENCEKIKVLSVADLFASAIESIHNETSVSKLF